MANSGELKGHHRTSDTGEVLLQPMSLQPGSTVFVVTDISAST